MQYREQSQQNCTTFQTLHEQLKSAQITRIIPLQ